jgi:hypothetical protein
MVKKIFMTLIRNPLLFILPAAGIALNCISSLLLLPDIKKVAEISSGLLNFESFEQSTYFQNMPSMMAASQKSSLLSLLYYIFLIVFIAGYGNMQAAVMNEGKALFRVFLFGIRKFAGKVILSLLLLAVFAFGISIIITIAALPVFIWNALTDGFSYAFIIGAFRQFQLISLIIIILTYPLIMLWLPAIFVDREDGVIACFKSGVRAGARSYFLLLPAVTILELPLLLLHILSRDMFSIAANPYYPLIFPYQMIVVPFIITYLFYRYDQTKKGKIINEGTCP